MKLTPLAAALLAAFAAPASAAYVLPERPDVPTSTSWAPTAPIYQAPELRPYLSEQPAVLPIPQYPMAPMKTYPELTPPTTDVTLKSAGLMSGSASWWVSASKADALAKIETAFKAMPLYDSSDYYTTQQLPQFDKFVGGGTMVPNFNVNGTMANYAKYMASNTNPISTDVVQNIASVMRGEKITVNGQEFDSVWISLTGSNGTLYTKEGSFIISNGSIWGKYGETLENIEQYLTAVANGTFTSPSDWVIARAINVNSPNYAAYQAYVQENATAMAAYKTAYAQYQTAADNYPSAWSAYMQSVQAYDTWQQANAEITQQNNQALADAQAGHQAALTQYQTNLQTAMIQQIDAMPQNRSMGGGHAIAAGAAAFGPGALASGEGSFAAGKESWAAGKNSLAVGSGAVALGEDAIALGTGAIAAEGIAIGAGALSESSQSVAIGRGARAVSSVAIGDQAQAVGTNTTAVGDLAVAAGRFGVALGAGAQVQSGAENAVALGAGSVATRANTVAVGGRILSDVADPILVQDAATKGYVDRAIASIEIPDISGLSNRVDGIDRRIDGVEKRIDKLDEKASSGVAMALAMASPVSLQRGESAISVGTGVYGGQSALALSLSHNLDLRTRSIFKEATLAAGIGASTAGTTGGRASISFKF